MSRTTTSLSPFASALVVAFASGAACLSVIAAAHQPQNIMEPASLSSARSLAASQQFPAAIAAYRQFLAAHPRNEAAELELAACYRKVHNEEEARRILQQACREHPRSAAVAKTLGNFEIEAQSYDAAIAALKSAVALAPNDLEARNFLGSAYQSKSDSALALAQFDYVLARDPQNGLALFSRAQIHADAGDDQKALTDVERLLTIRPDYLPARVLLAKILIRLKQCSRAAEALRPEQNAQQLDTQALFLLANAYDCARDTNSAKSVRDEFAAASQADRTRAENETQSKHLTEQAGGLARQNQFREALDLLQQALEKNSQNAFAYSQQAKIFFSMHQPAEARQAIDHALSLQPYQPDFLYVSGILFAAESNLDEALAAFEKVTQVNPREADAFFEIGKIHLQQGDQPAALTAFLQAVALDPTEPDYQRALMAARLRRDSPPKSPER